jgi:hypothetical protein
VQRLPERADEHNRQCQHVFPSNGRRELRSAHPQPVLRRRGRLVQRLRLQLLLRRGMRWFRGLLLGLLRDLRRLLSR